MFERAQPSSRSRDREEDHATPKPGAMSLAALEPVASPPLFSGDEAWEDLAPAARAAATSEPDGQIGKLADEHRKTVRDYVLPKELTVTDLARNARGLTNSRDGGAHADGMISVDIGTVVGSAKDGYKNAYVLVWKASKAKGPEIDPATNEPDRNSGDPTGWVRIGKLPKKARADIAKAQAKKKKKLRTNKAGAGAKAPTTGQTFKIAPVNPTSITEQFIARGEGQSKLEAFRIKGGSVSENGDPTSTPCGNYTINAARYGQNIVGVWNPPGSTGSNGKANAGSGGIRVFIPVGKELELCDVAPIIIDNYDTTIGNGSSTWVYVTCRMAGERIYFWMLRSWTFTEVAALGGKDRSGQNG
jgi:hypothetical protein